jgi:predicted dehydrogenase
MSELSTVGVGLVGAGFLARTRARCYAKAAGIHARLAAVCALTPDEAADFAALHGVAAACGDLDELLAREDVQLVDLCVPNHLHRPFAERAAAAGKHVVCTKPLTAYVGQDLPDGTPDADVSRVSRARMLQLAVDDAKAMVAAAERHGVRLMYGENWVYAPSIRRAAELVKASRGAVLELRGWEGHSGSHSPYAKLWRYTGGGALLRLGAHPLGAMLHLKRLEGLARSGAPIRPLAVTAEVADVAPAADAAEAASDLAEGWVDVENWGCAIVAFDDGSRGVAYGSDTLLGGMQSRLEVMGSNFRLACNLSPHDLLEAYAATGEALADEYVMEKASTTAGWNTFLPDEDWTSGHVDMCRDFALAVAEGRPAVSDGELGLEVTRLVYSAYLSAEQGRRVAL